MLLIGLYFKVFFLFLGDPVAYCAPGVPSSRPALVSKFSLL